MVQQLNKHEREAHRWEQPYRSLRVQIELDRENQVDPKARERVIRYRALEAGAAIIARDLTSRIGTLEGSL